MPVAYCPCCYDMLFPKQKNGKMYLTCEICPHAWKIKKNFAVEYKFESKKVDQGLRTKAEASTGPEMDINYCPRCSNTRAYFEQIQTRSADEPMTEFYQCTKCHYGWKQ